MPSVAAAAPDSVVPEFPAAAVVAVVVEPPPHAQRLVTIAAATAKESNLFIPALLFLFVKSGDSVPFPLYRVPEVFVKFLINYFSR